MATAGRDSRIGTTLRGKWRIDARLGRGGVATVYAATHRNGDPVAIKILDAKFGRNKDVRARFLREGYAANAVNHPGVVRVLDDDVAEDGAPFLVMDLLEGEVLDEYCRRLGGRLPISEVLTIAGQLLDVLAAAHEKGIIHRDIKPENLFLLKDGTLRVLDFGLARMRELSEENTATGVLLGTPEFMSPEQANGAQGQVDAATDIWATGATLFTLLSGQSVHDCESTTLQLIAAVSQPARSLGTVAGNIPKPIVLVVDRALAFEKEERWPSAGAMKIALEAAALFTHAGPGGPAPELPSQPSITGVTEVETDAPTLARFPTFEDDLRPSQQVTRFRPRDEDTADPEPTAEPDSFSFLAPKEARQPREPEAPSGPTELEEPLPSPEPAPIQAPPPRMPDAASSSKLWISSVLWVLAVIVLWVAVALTVHKVRHNASEPEAPGGSETAPTPVMPPK